ncbi:MAG: ADP-ribosylglycohydrolase family protein [Acidimicrobiales bacterium]
MTWSDMSPKDVLDGLAAAGLLPQPRFTAPVVVDMSIDRLRSSYRGAIIGTAIGDALGRPAEGRNASLLRKRYGLLTDFQPWRGWTGGPKGTITDDTQMTICVAECLLANTGRLDPGDLALRFIDWLPAGRGRGYTCVEAVNRLLAGVPWHEAGIASAGNGAAMRAAPVGLAHLDDFNALRHDAALSAIVTHRDPMAVASAVAHAWLVARLAARHPEHSIQPYSCTTSLTRSPTFTTLGRSSEIGTTDGERVVAQFASANASPKSPGSFPCRRKRLASTSTAGRSCSRASRWLCGTFCAFPTTPKLQ